MEEEAEESYEEELEYESCEDMHVESEEEEEKKFDT